MTKKKLNEILNLIDKWRLIDGKFSDGFTAWHKIVCPDDHPPIVQIPILESLLEALDLAYPEYKDSFHYYVWELPGMDAPFECVYDGKTYNAKDRDEYMDFMMALTE